jgi:organic radical activating enzyme
MEYLYRIVDKVYADFYGNNVSYGYSLNKYEIAYETNCGAWIWLFNPIYFTKDKNGNSIPDYKKNRKMMKFVNLKNRKKFACKTLEEALSSWKRRKEVQLSIKKEQLNLAVELNECAKNVTLREVMEKLK